MRIDNGKAIMYSNREHPLVFGLGIEDTFITQTARGERSLDEYELTQHYEFWRADLAAASSTGAKALRWGIPWHRVNPAPGKWDFDWVDKVVDEMAELGLEPIWDLMHYGTPPWLEGEFLHPDYPERVADYAFRVGERVGTRFSWFTPLNEPLLNILYCGRYAYWPPYAEGDDGFARVLRAVSRGVVQSERAFRQVVGDGARSMHVEAAIRYVAAGEGVKEETQFLVDQAYLPEDLVTGRVGADHPLAAYLLRHGWTESDLTWFLERPTAPDVMGVNYYPAVSNDLVALGGPDGGPLSPRPHPQDWATGLADVIRGFASRFQVPIVVSETCNPGSYHDRLRWLDDSVALVRQLREEGVDVRGYTWWSLIDMVEWDYRTSGEAVSQHLLRMGLWDLEPQPDGHLERRRNPVADRFSEYARGER